VASARELDSDLMSRGSGQQFTFVFGLVTARLRPLLWK